MNKVPGTRANRKAWKGLFGIEGAIVVGDFLARGNVSYRDLEIEPRTEAHGGDSNDSRTGRDPGTMRSPRPFT